MKKIERTTLPGNVLTEYGLLLGLVALVSVAGLKTMGNSSADLLSGVPKNQATMMNMVKLDFKAANAAKNTSGLSAKGPISLQGSGYYKMKINSRTGLPEFQLTGATSTSTNVTSLDGSQWNILGQFHLADSLQQLAESQTNPENAAYIMKLAELSYYMGGAEGEIDGVKGLELGDPYGKLNGYIDLQRLQGEMQTLLQNPPPNISRQDLIEATGMSTDVYNIAQSYVTALKPIAANATYGFNMPSDSAAGPQTGTPGQSLTVSVDQAPPCEPVICGTPQNLGGPTIEETLTLSYLQSTSKTLLSTNQISSEPVKVTLTDAVTLEDTSTRRRRYY